MAKEADERYRSARDLADDLNAFLNLRAIQARPSTQFDRLRRFAKTQPDAHGHGRDDTGLGLTAGSREFGVGVQFASQARHEAQRVAEAQVIERSQRVALYARDMQAAKSLAESRRLVELQEKLLTWVPEDGEEDLRGFEWFHLWQYCDDDALIRAFDHELPMDQVEFLGNDGL